jgi:hypothetical protein
MHGPLRASLARRGYPIFNCVVFLSIARWRERSEIRARRDKARGTASRARGEVGGRYRVLRVDLIVATTDGGVGSRGRGEASARRSKGRGIVSGSRKGTSYGSVLLVLHLALILGCGSGSGCCWTNAARIAAHIPRIHRWWRG